MVAGEKIVFYEAYEEVGVARSHFGTKSTVYGVAMGTRMGPSYAIYVGFIENNFFSNYHGPKPELYKGYIDDCVGATSSSREELNLFIN